MENKIFISLEGIDGCGKTTLFDALKNSINGYKFVSHKEFRGITEHQKWSLNSLSNIIWPEDKIKKFATEMPSIYWVYLQLSWFACVSDMLLSKGSQSIIMDGWYYKFYVKLKAEGYNDDELKVLFSKIKNTDKSILIDVDPIVVDSRGRKFSEYENGSFVLKESSYIKYQSMLRREYIKLAKDLGWSIVKINNQESIEDTLKRIKEVI